MILVWDFSKSLCQNRFYFVVVKKSTIIVHFDLQSMQFHGNQINSKQYVSKWTKGLIFATKRLFTFLMNARHIHSKSNDNKTNAVFVAKQIVLLQLGW